MNSDDLWAGTAWTRGVLAGAVLGGLGWGLFAALTVGARGDQSHLDAVFGRYLTVAGGISMMCLVISGLLARTRGLRAPAVALVVAPVSGWLVLGLQYVQSLVLR
ncbi:hypothetical protein [Mycolicibacterium sp. J2]|uniref:hypothetical protein n=1 Tax=Mycolicibacterium sp. J2 TaxID=2993511 RepID=UPI00224AD291|nr:hypothetical protein [Mycolicibacterium sp. J2]MCX2712623.1 hypothetical protein [Mycolicibacterium sp. J2]